MRIVAGLALAALFGCSHSQPPQPPATAGSADRAWIARSNENAHILLAVQARFAPEAAARLGQSGLDDRILDVTVGHDQRQRQATREALAKLDELRGRER